MLQAIAQSIDGTALSWAAGCCLVAGAAYAALRKHWAFRTRFEASVRAVEAAQGAYVGLSAAHHLLMKGGPLPVVLVQRMAGYLWFDTLYECVLPLVKGTPLSIPFLAHHLVGLAAHGLAKTHGPLRAVTAHVYLAELSTPSLHCSWFLKQLGRSSTTLYLVNGLVGALAYLIFRVAWPPLFVYWNRDPKPWDAERAGVHTAFLMCSAVFWALNLFWFRKLVAMARGARRKAT